MGCAFDTKGVPYVIKTSAPSGTDNAYTPPYLWLDTTADEWYLLTDVTAGTATWEAMSDKVPHSLTTAENDFLVGKAGGGEWVKKTLAETKTILEIVNPLVYKGVIDCSASPNYPAADAGYVYFVSVAGKIGGASGTSVDAGDKLVCKTDSSAAGDQATVGANWGIVQGNLVYETDTGEIKMNGTVSVGTSVKVPRADHVHASDTTKADKVITATAGNLAGLDAAGNLTDSGIAATAYDTLWVGAGAMIPCTTNGAAAITTEYGTNDIDLDVLAFDAGATEERAQFSVVMPENWDRGTLKAKFYWTNATGASAADTVEWGIKAGALSNDDAIDAALGTAVTVSDTVIAAGDLHVTAATAAITVGGTPALGDLVQFEVYRNTDGTDDMAEDAYLIGFLIQFTRNVAVSGW